MKAVFVFNEFSLHNHIITDCLAARPEDKIAIVKVPLVLKGKSRAETAAAILPKLPGRFIAQKFSEFLGVSAITLIPKISNRGAVFRRLRRIACMHNLPFHKSENLSNPDTMEFIRAQEPDVIITLVHQIIRSPLISLPRLGIINIHPGLLPFFRGIQPYFWELSENFGKAGPTLHFIEDEKIDSGGILAQASYATWPGMSVQLNYFLTCCAAAQLLPECLARLESGSLCPQKQDLNLGSYYRWPDSKAFERLHRGGYKLTSLGDLYRILSGEYDGFKAEVSYRV